MALLPTPSGALKPKTKAIHYHHVTIDGKGTKAYSSPQIYERAVLTQLVRLHNSQTGKALFREFVLRSSRELKIVPYEFPQLNAFASPKDLQTATLKGQPLRNGANGSVLKDSSGRGWTGTGSGSDADLLFTPSIWTQYCSKQKRGHKCGASPDEILLHEMVHATREMRGVFNPIPLGGLYDTEEEFFAILIANIYASETGRKIDLRSDHHTFDHLSTDTNALFLPKKDDTDYRYSLVSKLVRQEPTLANELRKVSAPFNPIKRYFELQNASRATRH